MKQHLIPATLAGALALTVSAVTAQTPSTAQTPPSTTTQKPASTAATPITVEGCLMRENDVHGKKANVAAKVGIGEDFILTSTKMVKGTAPGSTASTTGGAVGTSGTAAAMYDVNGIEDETLMKHINRRVQVDGTFENLENAGKTDAFVEIRATGIRPVSGECAPK
jgi:hypothetical protein